MKPLGRNPGQFEQKYNNRVRENWFENGVCELRYFVIARLC